jgi:hypothetical protein
MPGSYTTTAVLADSALETLKHAYEERESADIGSLILAAQEAIVRLKQALKNAQSYDDLSHDPYELSEYNSAV